MSFEEALQSVAAAMRASDRKGFTPIIGLAQSLGLKTMLRFAANARGLHAYSTLSTVPPLIVIFRIGPDRALRELSPTDEHILTGRERFSIAHEIGHWIALERLGVAPAPNDSREYWKQEKAIDAFAATLLIPNVIVAQWAASFPAGSPLHPMLLRRFAKSVRVSEEVAARAICRVRSEIGFLKLATAQPKNSREWVFRVAFVAAGAEVSLPPIHKYLRSSELKQLLTAGPSGSFCASSSRLLGCDSDAPLTIEWRRATVERSVPREFFWLAAARASTKQLDLPHANRK